MIEDFLAAGMAALLLHGPDMRIVYDRARYPAITPDDIEAAFKHERSRDAEPSSDGGRLISTARPAWPHEEQSAKIGQFSGQP